MKEAKHKGEHTTQFHIQEVKEQAKLLHDEDYGGAGLE